MGYIYSESERPYSLILLKNKFKLQYKAVKYDSVLLCHGKYGTARSVQTVYCGEDSHGSMNCEFMMYLWKVVPITKRNFETIV